MEVVLVGCGMRVIKIPSSFQNQKDLGSYLTEPAKDKWVPRPPTLPSHTYTEQ
jgi:hypothetical protein